MINADKLKLVIAPSTILTTTCVNVDKLDKLVIDKINQLKALCLKHKGVGLAANQVGWNARVFVMDIKGQPPVFINPEIVAYSIQTSIEKEACLSEPGQTFLIERYNDITINYMNFNGTKVSLKLYGLAARCAQHEIDHLNGILLSQRHKGNVCNSNC